VRALVEAGPAVLGNHEIGLLTAAGLRERKPLDSFGEVLDAADAAEWLAWLRRRPLLETGQLGRQRFAMVHASVHPDWSLGELERRVRRVEARLSAEDPREAAALLAADPSRDSDRSARPADLGAQRHARGRLVGGAAGRRARGLAPALVGARA
jgi:bis(5'-nucleosyl)-tetraphosphatase (symmetrical)